MKEAATIVIPDVESGDDAVVIIRYSNDDIAIAISQKSSGDVEVVMTKDSAVLILKALRKAIDG